MFNIGDIVEVVDWGKCYSSYTEMARHLKLQHFIPTVSTSHYSNVPNGQVVAIGNHLKYIERKVYGVQIRFKGKPMDVIMGSQGIKLLKRRELLDEDLFKI